MEGGIAITYSSKIPKGLKIFLTKSVKSKQEETSIFISW
jgi:hypothetical protein